MRRISAREILRNPIIVSFSSHVQPPAVLCALARDVEVVPDPEEDARGEAHKGTQI